MIYGIGSDLVTIPRMTAALGRHGMRLAQRLLHVSELADFQQHHEPARFLAKRFAAKEAFAKAVGTGLRPPVLLPAIAVAHDALGKPVFLFSDALAAWLAQHGLTRFHLSLADEREHALAFVVIEQ
jgi:holo-[acyl-carrier protein] synthase